MIFVAVVAALVWMVVREYAGPRKFVIVETFSVGQSANVNGIAIEVARASFQPGYDVRLSREIRDRSGPMIFIEGTIRNDSSRPLAVFVPGNGRVEHAVVTAPDGRSAVAAVAMVAATTCSGLSDATSILTPSERRRFSVRLPAERGSPSAWVLTEIRGGSLPAISLGDFAADSDCAAAAGNKGAQEERWRVTFPPVQLPAVERQDFYPFGAPTAQEIGINGRRYWTRWVPRIGY